MHVVAVLFATALAAQAARSSRPACEQVSADALTDTAVAEICSGDDAARSAANTSDTAAAKQAWEAAAAHYRRAATLSPKTSTKLVALNALANVYDAKRLDAVDQILTTLRELITLAPDDLSYQFSLAKVQEDHGLIDAAEETLLLARRGKPDDVEPYRQLAQFYSRRISATALRRQEAMAGTLGGTRAGEPDESGVFRVGGSVAAPARVDVQYPPEALAAGVQGVVILEVMIDPAGNVSNARVVRSIPMLDGAAMQAASAWHFKPTQVNGQAVPVKMMITVNFTP